MRIALSNRKNFTYLASLRDLGKNNLSNPKKFDYEEKNLANDSRNKNNASPRISQIVLLLLFVVELRLGGGEAVRGIGGDSIAEALKARNIRSRISGKVFENRPHSRRKAACCGRGWRANARRIQERQ